MLEKVNAMYSGLRLANTTYFVLKNNLTTRLVMFFILEDSKYRLSNQ